MAIHDLKELKSIIGAKKRLLGLDHGEKTIGMAVSDPALMIASPIGTIRRTKFTKDAQELARVITEYDIGGIVIGLPLNMDGSEGPRTQSVQHFADNLIRKTDEFFETEPEIAFWDERLSTAAVERFMIKEADMTRKKRGKKVDTAAAAWILQGALDVMQ